MKPLSQDHKDLGVVYTPDVLIEFICTTAIHTYILDHLDHNQKTKISLENNALCFENLSQEDLQKTLNLIEEITILDPAVGVGYFLTFSFSILLEIHEALIRLGIQKKPLEQIRLEIITRNLYGVDISPRAIQICHEDLIRLLSDESHGIDQEKILILLRRHIKVGNSLIGNAFKDEDQYSTLGLSAFDWDREFPEIALNQGFALCVGNPPWNILKPLEKEFFATYSSNLSKYKLDKQGARKIIEKLKTSPIINEDWSKYESSIKKQSEYYRKTYQYQSGLLQIGNKTRRVSGDINLYKLFLERVYSLLEDNGVCGIILPSGIHSDAGTRSLRQLLFEENEVIVLYSFENRQGIFPSIHKSFKFDIIIFKKNQRKTTEFRTVFMQKDPEFLRKPQDGVLSVSWDMAKRFSPSAWSIIEFKNEIDVQIVEKMYQHPILTDSIPEFSKIVFARELDLTIDSHYFNTENRGFPIFEGKMIEQFTHHHKEPRYWIEEINIQSKYGTSYSDFKYPRLGFRAVAASTNRRTMIATLIPPNSCCSNSIIYIKNSDKSNKVQMKIEEIFYLLGIFNSFTFDYLVRLKVSQNLNMFILQDMPLPRSKTDRNYREIVTLVKTIYHYVHDFSDDISLEEEKILKLSPNKKRALLDARVAHIYNLTYTEVEYILDQFHIRDDTKEMQLNEQKKSILHCFDTYLG